MVVLSIQLAGGEKRIAQIKRTVRELMPSGVKDLNDLTQTLYQSYSVQDSTYVILSMINNAEALLDSTTGLLMLTRKTE